ncbi:MAG: Crp/Fnr family transcriptional regulator [Dehalococcoidales bacterium]|nr:Crp/Fnr family transcriptional regulator [Dehalococcoidales bacterium]
MAAEKEFISTIQYFRGLSDSELDQLKNVMFEKTYERGDIIVYEGDDAEALYFIHSGAIKIFKTSVEGKEQILSIVRPGDSFNDVPVFDNGLNPASAQAMGPVVIYELAKNELSHLIRNNQIIAENTIQVLAGEIRELVNLVEDLSFRNVIGRVAKILLNYAAEETGTGPRLTQQEMAAMAGSAREVVGRSLKALEEDGLIKLNRQKVSITDLDALREMVEEPV